MSEDIIFGTNLKLPTLPGLQSSCETQLYKLLREIDDLFSDKCRKLKEELSLARTEICEKNKTIQELVLKLNKLKNCSDKNANNTESMILEKNKVIAEKDRLLKTLEGECLKLKEEVRLCKMEIEEKDKLIKLQDSKMKFLRPFEAKCIKMEDEYKKFQSKMSAKDKVIQQQEAAIKSFKAIERESLRSKESFEAAKAELSTKESHVQKLQEEVSTCKKMLKSKTLEIAKLNMQLYNTEKEVLEHIYNRLKSEDALNEKIANLTEKLEKTENSLKTLSESYVKVLGGMKEHFSTILK